MLSPNFPYVNSQQGVAEEARRSSLIASVYTFDHRIITTQNPQICEFLKPKIIIFSFKRNTTIFLYLKRVYQQIVNNERAKIEIDLQISKSQNTAEWLE